MLKKLDDINSRTIFLGITLVSLLLIVSNYFPPKHSYFPGNSNFASKLGHNHSSRINFFYENSRRLIFTKKAPWQMFDRFINTPLLYVKYFPKTKLIIQSCDNVLRTFNLPRMTNIKNLYRIFSSLIVMN